MRVAFFTEAFDPFTNGVVVLIKAYRDALIAAGHDVVIFTPNNEDRPKKEYGVVRMPSFHFAKELYPMAIPSTFPLRRFAELQFDIIHSHHPFSCGLLAERLSFKHDIPLVYTFHTLLTTQSHYLPAPKQLAEETILRVIRRHCKRSHCVTVSTQVMHDWLRRRKVDSPIQLVRPNVPSSLAPVGARERIRIQHNIAPDEVLVFCASRLTHEKNVDLLLRAVSHLRVHTPYKVLIAGSGLDEKELKSLANSLGISNRIIWAGEVPHAEMPDYYAAADLFAFPSSNDTLGMVVLEAMSARLPTVVIDRNGPAEVVRHNVDGIHTNFDPVSFSNALALLINHADLRQSMGAHAVVGCKKFCSPDTASGLQDAYQIAKEMLQLDMLLGKRRGFSRTKKPSTGPKVW
jgi:glycosyltransferase involved in cell wall biosynthesis